MLQLCLTVLNLFPDRPALVQKLRYFTVKYEVLGNSGATIKEKSGQNLYCEFGLKLPYLSLGVHPPTSKVPYFKEPPKTTLLPKSFTKALS